MTKKNYQPKRKPIMMADCQAQLHVTTANSKLGNICGIGYLSGKNPAFADGTTTTDCKGTCVNCEHCVKGCYAVRGETRFPNVRKNRIENTMQLRENLQKHFADIENYIKANNVKVVRYTESGEIESYDQLVSLYNVATRNPETRFYLYTKNYQVLKCFFDFRVLPNNMVVLISVWGEHGLTQWDYFKKYHNVKCFAVNAETTLKPLVYCPTYYKDENGKTKRDVTKTCESCRLCFDSRAKVIGCLEH